MWTAAFGQAFFSLGVGTGLLLTYGSYMRDEPIVPSAVTITVADVVVALLGGLVVFLVVFAFGLDPAASVHLAFVTLPPIFHHLQFGMGLGVLFFMLLFVAALTSAVAMLEVLTATLIDVYGVQRKPATTLVTGGACCWGCPRP